MTDRNDRLELLVLLFVYASSKPTVNDVKRGFKTLLSYLSAADARTALEFALETSVSSGCVEAHGQRSPRFSLTRNGERRLEAKFGQLSKASWNELRDRLIVPRCVARSDQSAAELKSFPALRNALALEAVGLEYRPRISASATLNRIAAKATGAARSDAQAVRIALVRRWLLTPAQPPISSPTDNGDLTTFNFELFVRDVAAAATHVTDGRWDGAKVFVNHVWRQLAAEGNAGGLDLDSFKARLLEANRRGLLHLSRADLVFAMPPEDVSESEIPSFGDVFHFIQA